MIVDVLQHQVADNAHH